MAEETNKNDALTKFPNAEQANQAIHKALPSAFDLFKPSVDIIKSNLVAFLLLVALPAALMLLGEGSHVFKAGGNSDLFSSSSGALGIFSVIGAVIALMTSPGAIILQIAGARKQAITWKEAFNKGLQQFWRFLGLLVLLVIILSASFLLFIVPFFFVLPRVFLAPYFLIDKKLGVIEAMKASNGAYKAHKGVWGIVGVFFLLNLASIVPIIGNIAANVLSFLYGPAPALRYEQILHLSSQQLGTSATTAATPPAPTPSEPTAAA